MQLRGFFRVKFGLCPRCETYYLAPVLTCVECAFEEFQEIEE